MLLGWINRLHPELALDELNPALFGTHRGRGWFGQIGRSRAGVVR
jgi:hypothetical protein